MLSVRQLRSHRNILICQALENCFINLISFLSHVVKFTAGKVRRDKTAAKMRLERPGEEFWTPDGVWVGATPEKRTADLPMNAYRMSSRANKERHLHDTYARQAEAAWLEAAEARAETLCGSGLAKPRGANPVSLAGQVADSWRHQPWREGEKHRHQGRLDEAEGAG